MRAAVKFDNLIFRQCVIVNPHVVDKAVEASPFNLEVLANADGEVVCPNRNFQRHRNNINFAVNVDADFLPVIAAHDVMPMTRIDNGQTVYIILARNAEVKDVFS